MVARLLNTRHRVPRAARIAMASAMSTLSLGSLIAARQIFLLGQVDDKLGPPIDNFAVAVQLLLVVGVCEGVLLAAIALVPAVGRCLRPWWMETLVAALQAVLALTFWPFDARAAWASWVAPPLLSIAVAVFTSVVRSFYADPWAVVDNEEDAA